MRLLYTWSYVSYLITLRSSTPFDVDVSSLISCITWSPRHHDARCFLTRMVSFTLPYVLNTIDSMCRHWSRVSLDLRDANLFVSYLIFLRIDMSFHPSIRLQHLYARFFNSMDTYPRISSILVSLRSPVHRSLCILSRLPSFTLFDPRIFLRSCSHHSHDSLDHSIFLRSCFHYSSIYPRDT